MLSLKNKLEIQDLLIELERNTLNYDAIIHNVIRNGEISNLEITIEVKDE